MCGLSWTVVRVTWSQESVSGEPELQGDVEKGVRHLLEGAAGGRSWVSPGTPGSDTTC